MLDKLFLSKLTKKGKIYYWVLQLSIDIAFIGALFLFYNYTFNSLMEEGRNILLIGVIASAVLSGIICLNLWKKPTDTDTTLSSNSNN